MMLARKGGQTARGGHTVGVAPGTITMSLSGLGCFRGVCPPDPTGWYPLSPFGPTMPAGDDSSAPPAAGSPAGASLKIYGTESKLSGLGDMVDPNAVRWDLVGMVGGVVIVLGLGLGFLATR